jgi:hypothetical protein
MSSYAYVSGEDSYALVKDGTKSHIRRGDGLCESDVYYVFFGCQTPVVQCLNDG